MNKAVLFFFVLIVVISAIIVASIAPVKRAISNTTNAVLVHASDSTMSSNAITTNNGPLNQLWDKFVEESH